MNVSTIDQVKIEARALVPLVQALERELGGRTSRSGRCEQNEDDFTGG